MSVLPLSRTLTPLMYGKSLWQFQQWWRTVAQPCTCGSGPWSSYLACSSRHSCTPSTWDRVSCQHCAALITTESSWACRQGSGNLWPEALCGSCWAWRYFQQWKHSQKVLLKQCCQVAEIPAKKLKRGHRKKKLAERLCGRILAEFYQKVAEKGPQKIFKRSSLILAMITTYNVHQDKIKFDF